MKRSFAVCLVAGLLLATSTAAFATPVSSWDTGVVNVNLGGTSYNNTNSGIISFSLPYGWNPASPSSYPGGSIADPILTATLTIGADFVSPTQTDTVSVSASSGGPWTSLGNLTQASWYGGSSTSTFNVAPAVANAWLQNQTTGYLQVKLTNWPNNQDDKVTTARLVVTTDYTPPRPPDPPDPPAPNPIPAPGAILLASMGAGLVSWLRARKAL